MIMNEFGPRLFVTLGTCPKIRAIAKLCLLFTHYGLSYMSLIGGEFAICTYDEAQKLFVAARDRYGINHCSGPWLMGS
jgi:hypothetical protein